MKIFFLWIVGLALAIFFGGFLVVLYGSHQRSPSFDPVIFDLSDRKSDGTSEKNPESIFYVPERYWGDFPSGYQEEGKNDFIVLTVDLDNFKEADKINMKDSVYIQIARSSGYGGRLIIYIDKIKNLKPDQIISGVKIYANELDKDNSDSYVYYKFTGFDGRDVIVQEPSSPLLESFRVYRKIYENIEIKYSLNKRDILTIYEIDEKIIRYIKSLQIPPSSFTKLK